MAHASVNVSSSKEDETTDHRSDEMIARNKQLEGGGEKAIITEEAQTTDLGNEARETPTEELGDDEMIYPSGCALALLTIGLGLCTFVVSPTHFVRSMYCC